jgi:hypothetical protein
MKPLSPFRRRVLRAAIAAIRPRGHGFDQPIDDDVLHGIETFLPFLPAPMRLGFPLGLYLIEFGPPLLARRWARLSRMPTDEARAYLAGLAEAGGLRASLLLGLRTLVFLNFYQHPQVLAAMGIDWAARAETLVRRRAALFDEHAA